MYKLNHILPHGRGRLNPLIFEVQTSCIKLLVQKNNLHKLIHLVKCFVS